MPTLHNQYNALFLIFCQNTSKLLLLVEAIMHIHRTFHLQNHFTNMNYTKKKCALWKYYETWPLPLLTYKFILSHLMELGKSLTYWRLDKVLVYRNLICFGKGKKYFTEILQVVSYPTIQDFCIRKFHWKLRKIVQWVSTNIYLSCHYSCNFWRSRSYFFP